jgi:hypothetical protein
MPDDYRIQLDRQRSVAAIVEATAKIYIRYPVLFAVLALAVVAPYELAVLAITGHGPLGRGDESGAARWVLLVLEPALIAPLISALHIHAVAAIGEGRRPRLGAIALKGITVLPLAALVDVSTSVVIYLGFLALLIPGLLLSLRWAVVTQVAAIEHESVSASIRRGGRLTAGHYWHAFGVLLVVDAITLAVTLGARALPLGSSSGVAAVVVGIAVFSLLASFTALTLALLYFDLRARYGSRSQAQPQPLAPARPTDLRPRTVAGLVVLVGGCSAALIVAIILGLLKRVDGHDKPALATLVVEVVFAAVMGALAGLACRRVRSPSAAASRLLMMVMWLTSALAVLIGIFTLAGAVNFAQGRATPTLGALVGLILITATSASCATLAHRESLRRATA